MRAKKVRGLKRKLRKADKLIPKGMYCYRYDEDGNEVVCPFWVKTKSHYKQENGKCLYTGKVDDYDGGLLWDKVKSCYKNETKDE